MSKTVGSKDQELDVPCKDSFCELYKNNVHVIAISQGDCSARLSQVGSAMVADAAANIVASNFDDIYKSENTLYIKNFVLTSLRKHLEFKANMLECQIEDLAANLLLLAVRKDKYIIIQLGDYESGYLDGTDQQEAAHHDVGKVASVKEFVTSFNAIEVLRLLKGELNKYDTSQSKNHFSELHLNHLNVFALSTGADSAKLAQIGSATIADAANHIVANNFDDIYFKCKDPLPIKQFVIKQLQNYLEFKANILQCQLEDLAATLLLVAACDTGFIVMHLGIGNTANAKEFVTSDNAIKDVRLIKGKLAGPQPMAIEKIKLDTNNLNVWSEL